MSRRPLTLALVALALSLGTTDGRGEQATAACNAFAWDLLHELRTPGENIVIGPASISLALAMTWSGARGRTADQMVAVLHLAGRPQEIHASFARLQALLDDPTAPHTLHVANRLWGQRDYTFLDSFLEPIRRDYGGGLERLDFRADPARCTRVINDWVAARTAQKIRELVPPGYIDDLTRLVLTNAIHFQADWQYAFPVEDTRDEAFRLADGRISQVPTMKLTGSFPYAEDEHWQLLSLPYDGGELEFVILLPKNGEQPVTMDLLARLSAARRERPVDCRLPRFELESFHDLGAALKKLGMLEAFDVRDADFSGMTGARDLYLAAVLHQAFIVVDEQGTEAGAATAVVMRRKSAPAEPVIFAADHPFTFVIRHVASETILFAGNRADPRRAADR